MNRILFPLLMSCLLTAGTAAADDDMVVDSNSALYEGVTYNYVFTAPHEYQLDIERANLDGYSMVFYPMGESYDSASVRIAVTIYDLTQQESAGDIYSVVLTEDTLALRAHFGESLEIRPAEGIVNAAGEPVKTVFLEDPTAFLPNVMVSYYDGSTEMIIVELSIAETFPRFMAEKVYVSFMADFKPLLRGTLEEAGR